MALLRRTFLSTALGIAVLAGPVPALADIVTANCTSMLDFDIYKFDTNQAEQTIDGIGDSEFSMDESEIVLVGDFGEYRFDLDVGTLYHNDSDTSVYCTYSTSED